MSLMNALTGACETQLRYLSKFQGVNDAFSLSKKNGALQFLASDFNIKAADATILELGDQRGKIRKARVVYSQRGSYNDSLIGQAAIDASLCDSSTTPVENDVVVEITNRVATRVLSFTNTQLNELCESPENFMQRYFLNELKSAREKLDRAILANLDAARGKILHADGSTTTAAGANKSIKVIAINGTTTERTPIFSTFNQIKLDYEHMELNGTPAIIGQGNINEFFDLMGYACCNSTTPFADAVEQSNIAFFLDQNANSVLGNNQFLAVAPGSSMLLTYNENKSLNMNSDLVKHYVLPDPEVPGLMWDVDFKWDECTKAYTWFASVWWDMFNTFQDDSFSSVDTLDGVTGIFGYEATAS